MKLYIFILIFFSPLLVAAQGGLIIEENAHMVIQGNPSLVIENGKFLNDGNFTADNSTVILTGTVPTEESTIGGASNTIFNNLTISKSSNDVRLDYDIEVAGDIQMEEGLLILNYSDILLDGSIIGETESTRITGTEGGAVIKTIDLGVPASSNPGNLGIEISSASDLGMTTIRRSHVQMDNDGNSSIYRRYDISPETNSNIDATLRFHYFDAELAGLQENELEVWEHDDSDWKSYGSESSSAINNWVEVSGVSSFYTFTLAESEGSLPIELLYFDAIVNERKAVDLSWTTTTEINNDYFTIERSKDGVEFEAIENIQGAGNTTQARNYKTVDTNPFTGTSYYRLRQTDFDGTQSLSDIRVVNIDLDQQYTVYPNPLKEILHIVGDVSTKGKTVITISDALGNIRYSKKLEMDANVNTLDIYEVAEFEAGNYFLAIQTADQVYTFNLVKVRK